LRMFRNLVRQKRSFSTVTSVSGKTYDVRNQLFING